MPPPYVAPPVVKPKTLFCPNCGGPVERRGFGHTLTVACPQCLSVLDASTPLLRILQQVEERYRRQPLIPLGTRGNLSRTTWEVIGFQTRGVESDGVMYEWEEYLLFNPFRGFRYLTQYNGHWNLVTPLESVPVTYGEVAFSERFRFRHFSSGEAITTFVLGEFPWRVRSGDRVRADDYVNPPLILSREATKDETTWSQGTYVPGADIWKAFALPGTPPSPRGVYLNQPSPYAGKVGGAWTMFLWMLIALGAIALFFAFTSKRETVLQEAHRFNALDEGETSFVTKEFTLTGRPATLELDLDTNLANNWAYFNFALINEDTGEAYDFGREVSYYYGSDSDGAWNEGSAKSSILLPAVPAGRYYLRVEPEMDSGVAANMSGAMRRALAPSVNYEIILRHDVPSFAWFLIAGGMLILPPIYYTFRAAAFERLRWAESDSAPAGKDDDDDPDAYRSGDNG
jgi:hypothetical protein